MIQTANQLKAKIRNLSGSDSTKAQTLIRNFIMERFLERISLSPYRNNFVLKGGMLVAAVVGLDTRATMDIDITVKSVTLSIENAVKMIEDIIAVEIHDGVEFMITKVTNIMEERDYSGIQCALEATLDKMRQTITIDISTGDIITPGAVEYYYPLMFEKRSISLWTYNLETLLAEKLETIMARGIANTRMRDFYDIHVILLQETFDNHVLKAAFIATSEKRNTISQLPDFRRILQTIETDETMTKLWRRYQVESFFVGDLAWITVLKSVKLLVDKVL